MSEQDFLQRLKTGRNDECLCGSGKKYKKCHLAADEAAQTAALAAAQAQALKDMKPEDGQPGPDPKGDPHSHSARAHKHDQGHPMKANAPATVNRQVSAPRKTGSG